MSILDDAIREHLELKRAHGADATELKKLEDEAFGPPARPDEPDPLAEAPTEFLATEGGEGATAADPEGGGRRVPIADLQEAPPPKQEEPLVEEAAAEEASAEQPSEEEHPAIEHELPEPEAESPPVPEPDASHSTGEREAIAEQPTEHFDVEAEMEPPAADAVEDEEEDDFFSEQRLSDELSQALDAPIDEEEDELAAEEEGEYEDEEDEEGEEDAPPASAHDDVLEDTPDFLEDTPEDDDLWFEQRPPKDFDFDD